VAVQHSLAEIQSHCVGKFAMRNCVVEVDENSRKRCSKLRDDNEIPCVAEVKAMPKFTHKFRLVTFKRSNWTERQEFINYLK